jgi:hypothetical protein
LLDIPILRKTLWIEELELRREGEGSITKKLDLFLGTPIGSVAIQQNVIPWSELL